MRSLLYKDEKLALQGWEVCSARRRGLLYKERRQDLTTIKRPQHPHKKVRVTIPSLALSSCKSIFWLNLRRVFGRLHTGALWRCFLCCYLFQATVIRVQGSCISLVNISASSLAILNLAIKFRYFWCRWGLNSKSLIQLSETLLVEQTEIYLCFFLNQQRWTSATKHLCTN